MKYAKMLGLAALAALAVMAVVGAGTASAKVCSTTGTGTACAGSHGKVETGNIEASLNAGTATLVSGFVTVNCSESTAAGALAGGGSSPATGTLTSLTFSKCETSGGSACTAGTNASGANAWPVTITTGAAPNGTMTVGKVTGEFTCLGTTCKYTAEPAGSKGEIVVKGGEPALIEAKAVALTKETGSGFLCSGTATWSGTYKITTPASGFLT
jgi:hypothetical protein